MLYSEGYVPHSHTLTNTQIEKICKPKKKKVSDTGSGNAITIATILGCISEFFLIPALINATTSDATFGWSLLAVIVGILTILGIIISVLYLDEIATVARYNRIKTPVSLIARNDRRWNALKNCFDSTATLFDRYYDTLRETDSPSDLAIQLDNIVSDYMMNTATISAMLDKPLTDEAKHEGKIALAESAARTARMITELFNRHDSGEAIRELETKRQEEERIAVEKTMNSYELQQAIFQTRNLSA